MNNNNNPFKYVYFVSFFYAKPSLDDESSEKDWGFGNVEVPTTQRIEHIQQLAAVTKLICRQMKVSSCTIMSYQLMREVNKLEVVETMPFQLMN